MYMNMYMYMYDNKSRSHLAVLSHKLERDYKVIQEEHGAYLLSKMKKKINYRKKV